VEWLAVKYCYGNSLQLLLCCKHNCFLTMWFNEEYWTYFISEILFKLKNFWSSYVKILYGPVYWDTDRQVTTVAMETTQLVLSHFKNLLTWWIENWIRSLCAKNSEFCKLVQLCHFNRSGPVFLDTMFIVNVSKAGVMRFVVVVVVINVVVNSSRCCCQLTSLCYR